LGLKFAEDFTKRKLKPDAVEKRLNKMVADRLAPEDKVNPGAEPPFTEADLPAARAMFNQVCAVCHGLDGRGMQNPEWRTAENLPIASRNFRGGVFKAGGRGRDIYTRIYAGIPGTPMPSFNNFKDEDVWRLVHFVQNLATPDGQEPWVLKGPAPATQPVASNQLTLSSQEAR
jgi:mono/diheme cytochrome c family protein